MKKKRQIEALINEVFDLKLEISSLNYNLEILSEKHNIAWELLRRNLPTKKGAAE